MTSTRVEVFGMDALKRVLSHFYERLLSWLQSISPATLQITGILGLAIVIIGYYQIKGSNNGPQGRRSAPRQGEGSATGARGETSSGNVRPSPSQRGEDKTHGKAQGHNAVVRREGPIAQAVAAKLQNTRKITISCSGVLLQQLYPEQLHESATLWPRVAEFVKEMCFISNIYLISQVSDDIGEALVSGALEAAGVVGSAPGQVPPHRLLFCSTPEGKVAMARQLEPELHIDGFHTTVDELRRFVPQLLYIQLPSSPLAAAASNVVSAASLEHYFC